MRLEYNYWIKICLAAVLALGLSVVAMAQDQNPPEGKDKGVWVLVEKIPDVKPEKDWDNGAYYNNHVSFSGTTVQGGYFWKDGDDPKDCRGKVQGSVSWNELPGVLEPGTGQSTTLTAEASGDQSCSARHLGAYARLVVNGFKLEPHPVVDFSSGDMKQDSETSKVSWEAPWGKIGENLTVAVYSRVPGSEYADIYYTYSYQANVPATPPNSSQMGPNKVEKSGIIGITQESWKKTGYKPLAFITKVEGKRLIWIDGIPVGQEAIDTGIIPLPEGSTISTGPDTNVIVTFKTTAVSIVSPNSEFVVKLHETASLDAWLVYENLIKGLAYYYCRSPKERKAWEKFQIETDMAIVGIKGTKFSVESNPGETIVKVAEGIVTLKSKATSEEIFVEAGQMATVTNAGFSSLKPYDAELDANWEKLQASISEETSGTGENNQYPDLSGAWEGGWSKGYLGPCQLLQSGGSLQFINENGQSSSGRFIDSETVIASDWEGGLIGHIAQNGNRIDWENGSWWTRNEGSSNKASYPDLSGSWEGAWSNGYLGPCQLLQSGGSLQFINENGQSSSGRFIDLETVIASDWEGGLIGHIAQNGNRIDWENGSWWER